jgi:hypothetical protein
MQPRLPRETAGPRNLLESVLNEAANSSEWKLSGSWRYDT